MNISDIKLGKLYHFPEHDIDMHQLPVPEYYWVSDGVIKIKASQPFVVLEKVRIRIYQKHYRVKVLNTHGDVGWLIIGRFSLKLIKPATP